MAQLEKTLDADWARRAQAALLVALASAYMGFTKHEFHPPKRRKTWPGQPQKSQRLQNQEDIPFFFQVFPMFLRKYHLWTSSFPENKGSSRAMRKKSLPPLCRGGGVDRRRRGETFRHGRHLRAGNRGSRCRQGDMSTSVNESKQLWCCNKLVEKKPLTISL